MVSLTCATDRRDGVTLVTARLAGSGGSQRVRLANRLDGPVWPPRRHGVPEAGWDEECFETVVPAGAAVAVGYASPAPPTDSPLAVVEREAVEESASEESATPADALRELGDPSPPRDAIPIPIDDSPDASTHPDQSVGAQPKQSRSHQDRTPTQRSNGQVPASVESWLDDVEERVARAEQLAAAETVPEATAALREAGSLEDAEALVETLQQDADALEPVASRAARLADRTAAADVPLATLERLA